MLVCKELLFTATPRLGAFPAEETCLPVVVRNVTQVTETPSESQHVDIEVGKEAARRCALNILSLLKEALGSLDKVVSYTPLRLLSTVVGCEASKKLCRH